jgi:hypothetical protein
MADAKSLAHGYVRMEEPDEVRIALLCKNMGTFCAVNGYRLGSVFIDRGVPDDVFARTGFIDLLDAVRLTGAPVVVVPRLDHLSSDSFIQDALIRMVQVAGSRVLEAYQERGSGQGAEIGLGCGCGTEAGS